MGDLIFYLLSPSVNFFLSVIKTKTKRNKSHIQSVKKKKDKEKRKKKRKKKDRKSKHIQYYSDHYLKE